MLQTTCETIAELLREECGGPIRCDVSEQVSFDPEKGVCSRRWTCGVWCDALRFQDPQYGASPLRIAYADCLEDLPAEVSKQIVPTLKRCLHAARLYYEALQAAARPDLQEAVL